MEWACSAIPDIRVHDVGALQGKLSMAGIHTLFLHTCGPTISNKVPHILLNHNIRHIIYTTIMHDYCRSLNNDISSYGEINKLTWLVQNQFHQPHQSGAIVRSSQVLDNALKVTSHGPRYDGVVLVKLFLEFN